MKVATLGYMIRDDRVLLGQKKITEVGSGMLSGAGGKLEVDEEIDACLIREHQEEFGIIPTAFKKAAVIRFFVKDILDFEVHTYLITEWEGEPTESEEMHLPEWHALAELPFERMLESDREWLPKLFAGEQFNADIYYAERANGFSKSTYTAFAD